MCGISANCADVEFYVGPLSWVECPNQWDSHTHNNKCTCSNGYYSQKYEKAIRKLILVFMQEYYGLVLQDALSVM